MLKKDARYQYRKKRENITQTDKQKWDDLILINFQEARFPFLDYVLSFYPIEQNNETDTFLITDYLHFKNPNLHICYARTDLTNHTMEAIECNADSIFEANAFNIPEPIDTTIVDSQLIDLVIVPLLAFDKKGNRVGYGKGFYDRYLKSCRNDCIKIGLCYFEPIDSIEDANEFDVPLDFCITPQRTYVF
jgi:5-formyltetrahydrofolate cyclo-ligase